MLRRILARTPQLTRLPILRNRISGRALIGIDFGRHSIKAIALRYQADTFHLEGISSVATPQGSIIDYQIQPTPPLIEALHLLKSSLNVCTKEVATAVSGSSVTTKIVHAPALFSDEVLALHMQQEALQHLSSDLDDISVDYEVLGPSEQSPERNRMLLSVARTEHIQARVDVLSQVGWQTKIVDIGSHALARATSFLWSKSLAAQVGVLDIGAQSMTFIVLDQGEVIHHRLQPLASDTISVSADISQAPQYTALIVQHTQRNLQLYCSHTGHAPPEYLYLFGGGAGLPLLAEQLAQQLSVVVIPADFAGVFDLSSHQAVQVFTFGTALGLALRCGVSCQI
ncbi:type IV pilus biogenesis protein PilM [Oceanisphaera pacifica]|uniref:Type IV pilus assembly protein PilM n=1 Tax=Oceanisphaera pacifica TaxID=2818389 RepID=A0ABS3ND28_9GAMM|nr:type IV pilus assembly protein PilM [Oceanisphaera pacifica]MBO1518382.1 type IV pilus assembly protein PilM [Oceanisphaera pacifica]